MKASEFVEILSAAIVEHGDLELVVGYDGSQAMIEQAPVAVSVAWDQDDGFGPRILAVMPKAGRIRPAFQSKVLPIMSARLSELLLSALISAVATFVLTCVMFYRDETNPSAELKAYVCEGKRWR